MKPQLLLPYSLFSLFILLGMGEWPLNESPAFFSEEPAPLNCQLQVTGWPQNPVCPNDTLTLTVCRTDSFQLTLYANNPGGLMLQDTDWVSYPVYSEDLILPDSFCMDPANSGDPVCQGHQTSAPQFNANEENNSSQYCQVLKLSFGAGAGACLLDTFDLTFHFNDEICNFEDPATYAAHTVLVGGQIGIFAENPNINPATQAVNEICTGDGPFFFELGCFCGNTAGLDIEWVYRDDAASPWLPAGFPGASCFTTPEIVADSCINSNTIVVNREYRLSLIDPVADDTCFYETDLQICCPIDITGLSGGIDLGGSLLPLTTTICEDDFPANIELSLSANKDLDPLVPGLTIDWEILIDGTPLTTTAYQDLADITVTIPTANNDIQIKAIVTNTLCNSCNQDEISQTILVDEAPEAGNIAGPTTLCPLSAATLILLNSSNCTPKWYVSDTPDFSGTVVALGVSNIFQNTNILPPENWNANKFYYRVICEPDDNSSCEPDTSATHVITLLDDLELPIISVNPGAVDGEVEICAGDAATFTITNYDPVAYDYDWYCNGILVATNQQSLVSSVEACYWVEATPNTGIAFRAIQTCTRAVTDPICVKVCEVKPIIICPPCVTDLAMSFTLDASESYSTCGREITEFLWGNGETTPVITINGPFTAGTLLSYTVIVTDSEGCSEIGAITVEVCSSQ
jgi:hypothetical protein